MSLSITKSDKVFLVLVPSIIAAALFYCLWYQPLCKRDEYNRTAYKNMGNILKIRERNTQLREKYRSLCLEAQNGEAKNESESAVKSEGETISEALAAVGAVLRKRRLDSTATGVSGEVEFLATWGQGREFLRRINGVESQRRLNIHSLEFEPSGLPQSLLLWSMHFATEVQ